MDTITMTADTWNELCSTIHALAEQAALMAADWCHDREQAGAVYATCADVNALLAAVDDANSRARYMALAADDQMDMFEVVNS